MLASGDHLLEDLNHLVLEDDDFPAEHSVAGSELHEELIELGPTQRCACPQPAHPLVLLNEELQLSVLHEVSLLEQGVGAILELASLHGLALNTRLLVDAVEAKKEARRVHEADAARSEGLSQ